MVVTISLILNKDDDGVMMVSHGINVDTNEIVELQPNTIHYYISLGAFKKDNEYCIEINE